MNICKIMYKIRKLKVSIDCLLLSPDLILVLKKWSEIVCESTKQKVAFEFDNSHKLIF